MNNEERKERIKGILNYINSNKEVLIPYLSVSSIHSLDDFKTKHGKGILKKDLRNQMNGVGMISYTSPITNSNKKVIYFSKDFDKNIPILNGVAIVCDVELEEKDMSTNNLAQTFEVVDGKEMVLKNIKNISVVDRISGTINSQKSNKKQGDQQLTINSYTLSEDGKEIERVQTNVSKVNKDETINKQKGFFGSVINETINETLSAISEEIENSVENPVTVAEPNFTMGKSGEVETAKRQNGFVMADENNKVATREKPQTPKAQKKVKPKKEESHDFIMVDGSKVPATQDLNKKSKEKTENNKSQAVKEEAPKDKKKSVFDRAREAFENFTKRRQKTNEELDEQDLKFRQDLAEEELRRLQKAEEKARDIENKRLEDEAKLREKQRKQKLKEQEAERRRSKREGLDKLKEEKAKKEAKKVKEPKVKSVKAEEKPTFDFNAVMLPISGVRTVSSIKSLKHEYGKSKKQISKTMVAEGDKKGKERVETIADSNMGLIFVPGPTNGKVDAWVYRKPDGKTPPIQEIFNGRDGMPYYDASKTLDENIARLTSDALGTHPYFAKVKKDLIERRKGKGNEDYYNILTYDTSNNRKNDERITVKDTSSTKTLSTFFDATRNNTKYENAFKRTSAWSDERVQRMARTLDEARSAGDEINKTSMLRRRGRELVMFVAGLTAGVIAGAVGVDIAGAESVEAANNSAMREQARDTMASTSYTQTLSADELEEINPMLAKSLNTTKANTSASLLNYSVVNGENTITGTSSIMQSMLNSGATLGMNRDEIVQGFAKVADASLLDLVTGEQAYRDPIQAGTWEGLAQVLAQEVKNQGIDAKNKVVYPMAEQAIIADYGNETAHEAFKTYLEEIGVHDTEAVATAYENAFVERYNELENTLDPSNPSNPGAGVEDEENFEINNDLKEFVGSLVGAESADIISISEKFPSTNGSSNRTIFAMADGKLYDISYNSSENTTNTNGLILEMDNAYNNGRMEINGYVKYSDVLQGIRTENDWKRIYNNMAEELGTNVYGAYIPDPETHNQLSQNADGSYNVEMLVIGDNGDMENVVARVARTDGKIVTLTEAYNAALTIYGADPVSGYKVYNDVTTSTLENTCPEAFQDANLAQQNSNTLYGNLVYNYTTGTFSYSKAPKSKDSYPKFNTSTELSGISYEYNPNTPERTK